MSDHTIVQNFEFSDEMKARMFYEKASNMWATEDYVPTSWNRLPPTTQKVWMEKMKNSEKENNK